MSRLSEIVLATHSAGKLREIRALCAGSGIRWRGLDEFPDVGVADEPGASFSENARHKALYYAARTGLPALADDSGLEVDALGGLPGVDSATYAGVPRDDAANNRKLVAALAGVAAARRTARFRCCMCVVAGASVAFECEGRVEGEIIDTPRGAGGFGYDPHFLISALGCTTAELSTERKNELSHRGRALRQVLAWLREG